MQLLVWDVPRCVDYSTKYFVLESHFRFPALPDFLRSSGFGTESTEPREYN
jgi:hypothetical protein